jgi:amino-acid N-acetyltransferase
MIRSATGVDLPEVSKLLESEKLPTVDLPPNLAQFFVEEKDGRVVGSIGLEVYGTAALLRSMAVSASHRNKGIAGELISKLLTEAKAKGIRSIYLITNTAELYFKKKGFVQISKENVERGVLASAEFNGLCPASSSVMVIHL